jgi:hypothetical protein
MRSKPEHMQAEQEHSHGTSTCRPPGKPSDAAQLHVAEIAAVTIEYGGELETNDGGFARFPGLLWNNPLGKA